MSSAVELGKKLFAIRSWSPVPVVAACVALLFRDRAEPVELWALWLALGVALACLGQALRAWVLGLVRDGTSGQNDYLEAVELNTAGPYSHVRNPLYVGNFLIIAGLCVAAAHPLVAALAIGFFVFEYAFIVPAEESFLRTRFGAAYDAWCAAVPRWGWRFSAHPSTQQLRPRFDGARALKKEHNPFAAWMSGILVVVGLRAFARDETSVLPILFVAEAVLLSAYVVVKGWKRGWWLRTLAR